VGRGGKECGEEEGGGVWVKVVEKEGRNRMIGMPIAVC
jgi:hypothetical protein